MKAEEKELIDVKFQGLHAAIMASQDMQKQRDENIINLINETRELSKQARDLGLKTNGRVTELEQKDKVHYIMCPNIKKLTFFSWFNTPLRIAMFFGINVFFVSVFNSEYLWGIVEKLFKLL